MSSVLVGITQRVTNVATRSERWDVLDQAWLSFVRSADLELVPIPNQHPDPASFVRKLGIRRVILSGGNNLSQGITMISGEINRNVPLMNDVALERDRTEIALLQESVAQNWIVVGVCRGMQMLNVFHGGALSPIEGHVATKHRIEVSQRHLQSHHEVNSFHGCGILRSDLASGIEIWATMDQTIEAFGHIRLTHYGIMWHPERGTTSRQSDIELFRYLFYRR